jgi:hypothetical protein
LTGGGGHGLPPGISEQVIYVRFPQHHVSYYSSPHHSFWCLLMRESCSIAIYGCKAHDALAMVRWRKNVRAATLGPLIRTNLWWVVWMYVVAGACNGGGDG